MKKILGISAFYHDAAASIVIGGKVVAAAQEERFSRIKHDAAFPIESIRYCLHASNLTIDELDAVVFYDKPLLKFERLMETYYAYAPKGVFSFVKAIPVWLKEKLFLKKQIYQGLKAVESYNRRKLKLLFTEHHLSHAASSFYPSNFKESALLTIDGVGEWATASIGIGKANKIHFLREMHFPHSLGLLYSAFTYFLGFKVNSGEYKLMGLAPYGNPHSDRTKNFIRVIRENLVDVKNDGSLFLRPAYFSFAYSLRMIPSKKWEKAFGMPKRKPEARIDQSHCDLAFAIQEVCEEIVLKMAKEAKNLTGLDRLCLSGGVALNCVANGKLLRSGLFKEIFIQPASGDAGGALGAALCASQIYFEEERNHSVDSDQLNGSYLGPEFTEQEIQECLKSLQANFEKLEEDELFPIVAEQIQKGKVIGWFQGRMEFGPRALGNRSIIADARHPEMQKKINLKIKFREGFRPFAPAVLSEDASEIFELKVDSPYMLLVAPIQDKYRKPLPGNYNKLNYMERLGTERSALQAICHVDFSARVQTVHLKTNPRFFQLLTELKQKSGTGMVINTSFNVRGEPIVCTPKDAFNCFMSTEMDTLVIGNFILEKEKQNAKIAELDKKSGFKLD